MKTIIFCVTVIMFLFVKFGVDISAGNTLLALFDMALAITGMVSLHSDWKEAHEK